MAGRTVINILSVISELNFGGGENRLLNLARSIDSNRFRLSVVTLYSPPVAAANRRGTLRGQFAAAGVKVQELNLPHPSNVQGLRPIKLANTAGTLATAVAKLRQLIVATRADAVDAHLETALYTAVPAAASAGIPAAVTLYSELDLWRIFDSKSYRRVFFPAIRRFNLRLCSAIFTDSRARALDLEQFIGESSPPIHVVPNGVRLDKPSRSRAEVLREFGIPAETRATIIGQVAGLVPFKGAAVLLSAARRAVAEGHDLYVLCVGDARIGPAYPLQLRRQAEELGISDRVRIQGYPGNIADVWSVIDVHVHASSIDSLPNAIIEGMSLGKPAVVSSVGAIPEHVDHGRTGLVIPPDDPAAAAESLLRLLRDRDYAARLGAGAYRRYLERFTPEITARAIEACLESMIDAHRSRRAVAR
jgi:glycosyltransferase involved in cell wall biosynthesis